MERMRGALSDDAFVRACLLDEMLQRYPVDQTETAIYMAMSAYAFVADGVLTAQISVAAIERAAEEQPPHLDEPANDAGSSGCGDERPDHEASGYRAPAVEPTSDLIQQRASETSPNPPQPDQPVAEIPATEQNQCDAGTTAPSGTLNSESEPVPAEKSRSADQTIVNMAAAGISFERIALATGHSSGYVRKRAKTLGVEPRKPGPTSAPSVRPGPLPRDADGFSSTERQIYEAIKNCGRPAGIDDMPVIQGAVGPLNRSSIPSFFSTLVARGKIMRIAPGRYIVKPPPAPDALTERELIEAHIAEHGVMKAPDFGDAEINTLYLQLRARGHTLKKHPPGHGHHARPWLLDSDGYGITRTDMIDRARKIIATERPLREEKGAAE